MSGSQGWCAGGCGARVQRFGPDAAMMCPGCTEVLTVWRSLPAARRVGRIPFGQTVNGQYVAADTAAT